MKPKPTTIDFAHALAAYYRDSELGVTEIHLLTLIIARLARKLPTDTKSLMDCLPGKDRRLTSNIITSLERKDYVTSTMKKEIGLSGHCRVMKPTEKTRQFLDGLRNVERLALALLQPHRHPINLTPSPSA